MALDPFSVLEEGEGDAPGSDSFGDSFSDVPRETFWSFVLAALLLQAGLLAASLGLMYALILGQSELGTALFVGGAAALGLAGAIYLWHRARE